MEKIYKPNFTSGLAFFVAFGIGSLLKDYFYHQINFSSWVFFVIGALGLTWFAVTYPILILTQDGIYQRYLYGFKPKLLQRYTDIKAINFNNNLTNPNLEIVSSDNRRITVPLNLYPKKSEFLATLGNYKMIEFAPLIRNEITEEQLKQSSKNIVQMLIAVVVILIISIVILVNWH